MLNTTTRLYTSLRPKASSAIWLILSSWPAKFSRRSLTSTWNRNVYKKFNLKGVERVFSNWRMRYQNINNLPNQDQESCNHSNSHDMDPNPVGSAFILVHGSGSRSRGKKLREKQSLTDNFFGKLYFSSLNLKKKLISKVSVHIWKYFSFWTLKDGSGVFLCISIIPLLREILFT